MKQDLVNAKSDYAKQLEGNFLMAIVLVVAIAYGTLFRFGSNSTTTGEYQIGLCQRIWRYIHMPAV